MKSNLLMTLSLCTRLHCFVNQEQGCLAQSYALGARWRAPAEVIHLPSPRIAVFCCLEHGIHPHLLAHATTGKVQWKNVTAIPLMEAQRTWFLMPPFRIAAHVTDLVKMRFFSDPSSIVVGICASSIYFSYSSRRERTTVWLSLCVSVWMLLAACISWRLYI